jgi:hypothetical protein
LKNRQKYQVSSHAEFALQRRRVLAGLGAAALLIISGCGTLRRQSELDAAFSDLDELLAQAQEPEAEQLAAVASSIKASARLLIQNHEQFIENFNEEASKRSVSAAELEQKVVDYDRRRREHRNQLLQLQDELHEQMPPELWPEALAILNRKGQSIGSHNLSES